MNKEEFEKLRYEDAKKRYGAEGLRQMRKNWLSSLSSEELAEYRKKRAAYMREYQKRKKLLTK